MKVNRITFDKLKAQYEITKMAAAYILAERKIISESSTGMADGMAIEYEFDPFGNVTASQPLTVRDAQIAKLEEQCAEMEVAGRKLLEQEKYELMKELKEIYELAKKQLKNLKNDK